MNVYQGSHNYQNCKSKNGHDQESILLYRTWKAGVLTILYNCHPHIDILAIEQADRSAERMITAPVFPQPKIVRLIKTNGHATSRPDRNAMWWTGAERNAIRLAMYSDPSSRQGNWTCNWRLTCVLPRHAPVDSWWIVFSFLRSPRWKKHQNRCVIKDWQKPCHTGHVG